MGSFDDIQTTVLPTTAVSGLPSDQKPNQTGSHTNLRPVRTVLRGWQGMTTLPTPYRCKGFTVWSVMSEILRAAGWSKLAPPP